MRRILAVLPLGLPLVVTACPGPSEVGPAVAVGTLSAQGSSSPPRHAHRPVGRAPSQLEEKWLDRSTPACTDFFQFACGGFVRDAKIPDSEPGWSSFRELARANEEALRAILEKAKSGRRIAGDTKNQLRAFYGSCMDESAIEKRGVLPLRPSMQTLARAVDRSSLARAVGLAHKEAVGATPFFAVDAQADGKDASQIILGLSQAGLGLPERDYYFSANKEALRTAYRAWIESAMTRYFADIPKGSATDFAESAREHNDPKKIADSILSIETRLAKASMSNVDLRDPHKTYNRIESKGLLALAPGFDWATYLRTIDRPGQVEINVAQKDFFTALSALLTDTPLYELRNYMRWHVLRGAMGTLGAAYRDSELQYRKALTGVTADLPRWLRCVRATDHALGETLARPFVEETLGEEGKQTVLAMVRSIEEKMKEVLQGSTWMDEPTRTMALTKLAKIRKKIGFPDRFRDYSSMELDKNDYAKNRRAAHTFEFARRMKKIGKPVDRDEWQMSPPTVNAYYEPTLNEIVFPAGILQGPFFQKTRSRAANFGAIGMVMGHEVTHGFDDEGRQYDADGNLRDWWTKGTAAALDQRAACVDKQFSEYVVLDGLRVNGKLTLGENIADLGGIKLAYLASQATASGVPGEMSDAQQFFVGYAQVWCSVMRPEAVKMRLATDPHAPPKLRVNGPLSNYPPFAQAFGCQEGDPMVRSPKDRCEVW